MDRPLEDVRPIGPFAQLGNQSRGVRVTEIRDNSIVVKTSNLSEARARKFVTDWISDNFASGIGQITDLEVLDEPGRIAQGEKGVFKFIVKE